MSRRCIVTAGPHSDMPPGTKLDAENYGALGPGPCTAEGCGDPAIGGWVAGGLRERFCAGHQAESVAAYLEAKGRRRP